jgi:ABC-type oligopeptide transport system substrate-binding subunit
MCNSEKKPHALQKKLKLSLLLLKNHINLDETHHKKKRKKKNTHTHTIIGRNPFTVQSFVNRRSPLDKTLSQLGEKEAM